MEVALGMNYVKDSFAFSLIVYWYKSSISRAFLEDNPHAWLKNAELNFANKIEFNHIWLKYELIWTACPFTNYVMVDQMVKMLADRRSFEWKPLEQIPEKIASLEKLA